MAHDERGGPFRLLKVAPILRFAEHQGVTVECPRLPAGPGGVVRASLVGQAAKDAALLNNLLPMARTAAALQFKIDLPEFSFVVKDRSIVAEVAVTDAFLQRALELGQDAVEKDRAIAAERAAKAPKPAK